MSTQSLISEKLKARQNPYLLLESEEALDEATKETASERRQTYFIKLQEPAAYGDLFGEADEPPAQNEGPDRTSQIVHATVRADKLVSGSRARLEELLDAVLGLYKPYVAREHWVLVKTYRSEFLNAASRSPASARQVAERLQTLKFSLMPGEKVEYNRAPAEGIINELKRLLI